jgi:hypothetical protein
MNNNFKPNIKGQAELILKTAGGAAAKTAIHAAFVNYKEIAKEQVLASFGTELQVSKLGLPMFDVFKFNCSPGQQIIYEASKEFGKSNVVLNAPFVFETALIDVNQTKNIVKTSIAGQNGTVKEYMSEGDFVINLKGVIVGETANQRPTLQVLESLVAYLKCPVALPISCSFLDQWLINSIVVESYKLSQREGARNIIDIEINMISDSAIELSTSLEQKDIFSTRVPYVQKSMF